MPLNRSVPDVKAKRIQWKELGKNLPAEHLVFLDESRVNLGMAGR